MTMKEKIKIHDEVVESNKYKEMRWKEGMSTMKKAVLIKTNGEISVVDYPENNVVEWMSKQIGCDLIECVRPKGLPEGVVLVVDEEGLLVDQPKLNLIPSYLYGFLEHDCPICGDALIVKEVIGYDGYDFDGMDENEASEWEHKFREIEPLVELLMALKKQVHMV